MVGFMNTYSSNKRAAEGCLQGATQNKQHKREHNVAHRKEEKKERKCKHKNAMTLVCDLQAVMSFNTKDMHLSTTRVNIALLRKIKLV